MWVCCSICGGGRAFFSFFFLNSRHRESCRKGNKQRLPAAVFHRKTWERLKCTYTYLASIKEGIEQNHSRPGTGGGVVTENVCACSIKLLDRWEVHISFFLFVFFFLTSPWCVSWGNGSSTYQSLHWTKICGCVFSKDAQTERKPKRWKNKTERTLILRNKQG